MTLAILLSPFSVMDDSKFKSLLVVDTAEEKKRAVQADLSGKDLTSLFSTRKKKRKK